MAQGTVGTQIREDESLHSLVYELSGNPLLSRTAEAHWRFLRRVMGEVLRHAEPAAVIWEQHANILGAVCDADPQAAEELARTHIYLAAERLADAMNSSASRKQVNGTPL